MTKHSNTWQSNAEPGISRNGQVGQVEPGTEKIIKCFIFAISSKTGTSRISNNITER